MNLLNVIHTDSFGPRKGTIPLMVEFRVNPETGPFLVTSSRSFVWVSPKAERLRTAVRSCDPFTAGEVFGSILHQVADKGVGWGSVHPMTMDGYHSAKAYLAEYELTDVELVAHPNTELPPELDGHRETWVPEGWAVLLPTDREFVGFMVVSGVHFLVVVHNASRSIGILRP
jgi:hypothetical protein